MSLADEIEADIYSDDFEEDLLKDVVWAGVAAVALVQVVGVDEGFESPGGPVFSAVREFKFRRTDLAGQGDDLAMHGDEITYADRTYDVTEVDERPDHPLIVVTATLRE